MQAAIAATRDALGVDHAVYHWVNSLGERYGVGTYSDTWVDRYLDRNYLSLDPVIFGCVQSFTPVNWKAVDWSSRQARDFMKDAIAHGVGNQGYSIPMRGPAGQFALFTVSDSCDDAVWAEFIEDHRHPLIIISHEFNKKALEFEPEAAQPTPSLSPREVAAITCIAKGMNRAQAAVSLQISEHTLRVYIESARNKLGALNTTHAVARALSHGLIVV
ncbi:MAG: LuxR family transcriptional regulator [Celeribacter sp.]